MVNDIVYILPCSGIGKVFGSIGRDASYIVVNELAKEKTKLSCLPLVVKGKQDLIDDINNNHVIVIDGCPLKCSYNDVKSATGKEPEGQFLSMDVAKENRDLKPEKEIIPMRENAKKLSRKLAEKIAEKVDSILDADGKGGE
ncbi:MAG: putative zinc-binding protein [Promethearchaeota archaeon]